MDSQESFQNSNDKFASTWMSRIKVADKAYEKWATKMKCEQMENYYSGEQWPEQGNGYEPYVINMVFSTIEVKLPTLLFSNPIFTVSPKPRRGAFNFEMASKKALLRQDLLNTIITENSLYFGEEAEQTITGSMFRFGVLEVGYSATWVENPNADKPILKSDNEPYRDDDNNVIKQPKKLPQDERIYVKNIPASRFRVGGLESTQLERCNWVGYFEYMRVEDLKADTSLTNLDKLNWAGSRSDEFTKEVSESYVNDLDRSGDLIKIWHIWDNRSMQRMMFAESQSITLKKVPFKKLGLFDLRHHKDVRGIGWYPVPPTKNWKPPQDELNDVREANRNHRKRFVRKLLLRQGALIEQEGKDQLLNGPDGTVVDVQGDPNTVAAPVPNADLGAQANISLQISKDDFNIVAGTSAEERGEADRVTATQAGITNQKSQIRDNRHRTQVAKWLSRIGTHIIWLVNTKYTLPVWVKMSVDPTDAEGIQDITEIWHEINASDLDDENLDFEVAVSLNSLSPVANDDDKKKLFELAAFLSQYPEFSTDPDVIREIAYRIGYRNEKIIMKMQKSAQIMLIQKMEQGTKGSEMGQAQTAGATPPLLEQLRNNMANHATKGQGILQQ